MKIQKNQELTHLKELKKKALLYRVLLHLIKRTHYQTCKKNKIIYTIFISTNEKKQEFEKQEIKSSDQENSNEPIQSSHKILEKSSQIKEFKQFFQKN